MPGTTGVASSHEWCPINPAKVLPDQNGLGVLYADVLMTKANRKMAKNLFKVFI